MKRKRSDSSSDAASSEAAAGATKKATTSTTKATTHGKSKSKSKSKSSSSFDYSLDFKSLDMRAHPELYRIGRGEQGVLSVEPYKSEILPHWRFRTPDIAAASADAILGLYDDYKKEGDFVGMDMCRKFLQMGFTRSRRYANHRSGRKYSSKDREDSTMTESEAQELMSRSQFKDERNRRHTVKTKTKEVLPLDEDPVKARSAEEFMQRLNQVKADPDYLRMKAEHQARYEGKQPAQHH